MGDPNPFQGWVPRGKWSGFDSPQLRPDPSWHIANPGRFGTSEMGAMSLLPASRGAAPQRFNALPCPTIPPGGSLDPQQPNQRHRKSLPAPGSAETILFRHFCGFKEFYFPPRYMKAVFPFASPNLYPNTPCSDFMTYSPKYQPVKKRLYFFNPKLALF